MSIRKHFLTAIQYKVEYIFSQTKKLFKAKFDKTLESTAKKVFLNL